MAQVPHATTASALGASRSIHSLVVIGWPGVGIGSQRSPVAFVLDLLVRNRAFHHQHEGIELPFFRLIPVLHEVVAVFVGEHRIVQVHFGQAGDCAQQHIFDAGLGGRGDRDGISVAAESGGDPDDVNLRNGGAFCVTRPYGIVSAAMARSPFSFSYRAVPVHFVRYRIRRMFGNARNEIRVSSRKIRWKSICVHLTEISIVRIDKLGSLPQAGAASIPCRKNTATIVRDFPYVSKWKLGAKGFVR